MLLSFTIVLLQTCMPNFVLWAIKEAILKNVGY